MRLRRPVDCGVENSGSAVKEKRDELSSKGLFVPSYSYLVYISFSPLLALAKCRTPTGSVYRTSAFP